MKKFISVLLLHLLLLSSVIAQVFVVEGTVVDNAGQPLPGVNVLVDGTYIGTVTNLDGFYSLEAPSKDVTLVYSFIGMNTIKENVNGRNRIDVVLTDDSKQLDDVMVVAYGTTTKEAYTGAAEVVDSKIIEDRPVTSFEKSLQGTTAGLQVTSSSGQPGATATVRIRGIGSLNASSSPLYVVDGIPMAGALTDLNPNDIESLTVLKDAAAASLYGSRAANGVIIINTKKGKAGQTKISFNGQVGVASRVSDGYELMNSTDIYEHNWKGLYNWGLLYGKNEDGNPFTSADAIDYAHNNIKSTVGFNPFGIDNPLDNSGNLIPGTKVLTNTNWRDAIYKTGIIQNYSINVSGGNETTDVFFSFGYYNDSGTTLSSDFTRYTSKINVNHKVNNFITAGISNHLSYSKTNAPPGGTGFANPVRSAEIINAATPIYNNDGNYNWDNTAVRDFNPVGLSEMDIYRYIDKRAIVNSYINVNILPSLSFRTTGAVDYSNYEGLNYFNPDHGDGAGVNGRSIRSRSDGYSLNISNILRWTKQTDDSSIEAFVGQEALKFTSSSLSAGVTDFPLPGYPDLGWGSTPLTPSSGTSEWSMASYLGQVSYNYLSRYYLNASVRGDGSSRFGKDKRWGVFYAVGGSWRVTQEPWMPSTSWLNNLKLRASYGTSGNNSIPNYASLELYSSGANYGGYPGLAYSQLPNDILAWEKNTQTNIGLETTVFDRIDATIEYYDRKSEGLLYYQPLSSSTGVGGYWTNLAAMKNNGVELTFNYDVVKTTDWAYSIDFNITTNNNKILKLNLAEESLASGDKILEEGGDLYQFYLQEWAGVNPDNGKPMWYVNTEDSDLPESAYIDPLGTGRQVTSAYTDAGRAKVGSALPDFYGGFTNSLSYKNLDFSFYFYYSIGGKIYNYDYATNMHDGAQTGNNLAKDALNAWSPNNRYTDVPRYINTNLDGGEQMSSRFLEDGTYVRLKNISLGYNFSNDFCQRLGVQGLKAFVSGENLFTFSKYRGFDPEGALSGSSVNTIPGVKVVTVGVKIDL